MQKSILSIGLLFSSFIAVASNGISNSKISFTENKGQISDQNYKPRPDVLFSGTDGEMVYHIKNTGISYQLNRVDTWMERQHIRGVSEIQKYPDQITTYRVDVNWKNANIVRNVVTDAAMQGTTNYYLTVCPDGITNVKSYQGVTLKNIYSNIDVHYYEKSGSLKYDYIVAPNADYKQIALEIKGAELAYSEDGGIILKTPLGDIKEGAPIVFQNGKQLVAKWLIQENTLSFDISNYNSNYALIIDPLTRVWGTYYGGTGGSGGNDQGMACLADASGNSYLYGHTESTNTIATSGAHQTTKGGGALDVFLVKFDTNGQRVWGTYIGGSSDEVASNAVIDLNDNIYISGETSSTNAIGTSGTQQPTNAGQTDAFIVKFNSSGVRQWGTYYGGNGPDSGKNLAIAPDGSFIVIAGETASTTGLVGGGAGGQAYGGGAWDAFVAKFSLAGIRSWGTYYGGTVLDDGYSCAVDIIGNVYLSGLTESDQNIATSNAFQTTRNGGRDAFFVKFNSNGTRQWGTYFGGSSIEVGTATTTDASGNIYFCGWTTSGGDIATIGAFQTAYGGGNEDTFVAKFRTNGTRIWGTYIGGSGSDQVNGCTASGTSIYIAGKTNSAASISTSDGFQPVKDVGSDGYLVKLDTAGNRVWGTYYGGNSTESIFSCAVDNSDNIFMGGIAYSTTGIASTGSYQSTMMGTTDAFLIKLKYNNSVFIQENNFGMLLNAFPNPTTGEIKIDLDKLYENVTLKIYTIAGQKVMDEKYSSTLSVLVDIKGEAGMYVIEIQTPEGKTGRLKVVKK